LYLLKVEAFWQDRRVDQLYETFGLRRIAIDSFSPRLLLNVNPVQYAGVAILYARVSPEVNGQPRSGTVATTDDMRFIRAHAALPRTPHRRDPSARPIRLRELAERCHQPAARRGGLHHVLRRLLRAGRRAPHAPPIACRPHDLPAKADQHPRIRTLGRQRHRA